MGLRLAGRAGPLLIMAVMLCSVLVASPYAVHAATGTIVQNSSVFVADEQFPTVTFASSVSVGDVIVVAIVVEESVVNIVTSVTDTLGTSYTEPAASPSILPAAEGVAYMYYGTAPSSGADTIKVSMSSANEDDLFAYEVSGITTAGAVAVAGTSASGATASESTSPATFTNGGFLIADTETDAVDTCTPGAGFTCAPEPAGDSYGLVEYSTSGVSSPTTFPLTLNRVDNWDEVGIVFLLNTPTNPPTPLPPVIPKHLTFNFASAPSIVGNEVSPSGLGVLYNVKGYSPTTDTFPNDINICSNAGNSTVTVKGFLQLEQTGNATEFLAYYWSSLNFPSAGWPKESSC